MRLINLASVFITLVLISTDAYSSRNDSTNQVMEDALKIAHAISVLQPRLSNEKYIEYGMGIYRASKEYSIPSSLLIAIAYQETSFRENLPEGRAGEIGITQILKRWLRNKIFRKEFKHASIEKLKKPSYGFLYSAWILHNLKHTTKPGRLPYWSYYNARRYDPRAKYYQRIRRHLKKIERNLPRIEAALYRNRRELASLVQPTVGKLPIIRRSGAYKYKTRSKEFYPRPAPETVSILASADELPEG